VIDGPSVQNDIWEYYKARSPGQIMVLGPDLFNGTFAQLAQARDQIGATFPMLLNGSIGAGNENLWNVVYGDRDNYAVINKQGIVRYNAFDHYNYGNRYHLNELQGCIDSLLTVTTDVDDGTLPHAIGLEASPNPARGAIALELANPSDRSLPASVEVYDLAGRSVATLWDGLASQGVTHMSWSGRSAGGADAAPGLYLVRARIGSTVLTRRVLRIR
jgi:hypothetical protein